MSCSYSLGKERAPKAPLPVAELQWAREFAFEVFPFVHPAPRDVITFLVGCSGLVMVELAGWPGVALGSPGRLTHAT